MPVETEEKKPKILKVSEEQKVQYCIPLLLRDEQIRSSIKRVKGRLQHNSKKYAEPIAVVCYGPSLADTWEKIKEFKYVISCSGAHKFLIERGVVPNWQVEVDPREHKIGLMGSPHKDVEYLIASACHPKLFDHLEGFNVKLWHVFDNSESARVLPHGEWSITGGCSVGLRAMTLAAFLGFTDLHIFGMDGSFGPSGNKHAAAHPNEAKQESLVEYPEGSGKFFTTTVGFLEAARQTFHELDQMPSVKATFYGEGLVQSMACDYKPKPRAHALFDDVVAFEKPRVISEEFRELNHKLHQDNIMFGARGSRHADTVKALVASMKTNSVLDYGCGKGMLAKALQFPLWEYDPGIPEKAESPRPADLVVCTDVLEHVEPERLKFVLDDLRRVTRKVGFFVINTGPASKTYADGRNTHLIQKDAKWWAKKLRGFFSIGKIIEKKGEIYVVVGPKKDKSNAPSTNFTPAVEEVAQNGTKVSFLVTNEITKFRAHTLLTKEPITIEWINSMKRGDVFLDIGANIGGYSLWAAARGLYVYAFEPAVHNYLALQVNIALNKFEDKVTAYCAALSNKQGLGSLALSSSEVGAASNTFGGKSTQGSQGCVALTLDSLVLSGQLPQPNHIKLDVDGLEPEILEGAMQTLKDTKSLLVEGNRTSAKFHNVIQRLYAMGFDYDREQVERATRKDGPWKGYAEFLFTKEANVSPIKAIALEVSGAQLEMERVVDRISCASLNSDPFPYFYVEGIWSPEFYQEIHKQLLDVEWKPIGDVRSVRGYPDRYVGDISGPFWQSLRSAMCDGKLRDAVCQKLGADVQLFKDEILLIKDMPGYSIGPHTDSPVKVSSLLFYLPQDGSMQFVGTSIYVPKDKDFKCAGGPHYSSDDFDLVATMPFMPNTLFGFLKTNQSFHGVEPFTGGTRYSLLYDVRR